MGATRWAIVLLSIVAGVLKAARECGQTSSPESRSHKISHRPRASMATTISMCAPPSKPLGDTRWRPWLPFDQLWISVAAGAVGWLPVEVWQVVAALAASSFVFVQLLRRRRRAGRALANIASRTRSGRLHSPQTGPPRESLTATTATLVSREDGHCVHLHAVSPGLTHTCARRTRSMNGCDRCVRAVLPLVRKLRQRVADFAAKDRPRAHPT